ncbi:UvrD-helicase domain-containing protein [Acinetobacter junii]|uniref:UvrD-helicase domain-containing protein n=1 Tax=Acinetobacter junii TaxID=40215 RepID=UPI0012501FAC|nr:UvrD-helicase domain-containing protein [Acinetobacter junii]MDH0667279.1 UvrD-helicase domain-containing protein [Acinetobacter junii]MDH0720331.1 UvrD-helicase domain-containing protein [Acinetobacter junii]QQV67070.1 ATP-dependent DNA helicase UvrD/PcrA [Acinetobacter junii]
MSQTVEITDEDIRYAENILLPQGKIFDDERRRFIRNLSTIDLQAVPGSGKTTALLAKLLILETKLPLANGSGILVLSHTNTAVDEIKERIHKYCPKLFRYPHFIGTIQSFVNEFLAVPYYLFRLKKKPLRIDNEIYAEQIEFALSYNTKIALSKRSINYIDILSNSFISNNGIFQHFWSNNEVNIPKIGSHTNTYKELATIKINLLKTGILSFGDCYALAQKYLSNYPIIHKIINKRFQYVFIDEMQDMDTHQYELIEIIFAENNDTNTIIQRIGDKNQSIYNSIKAESIWQDRDHILHLSNSQRLSRPIANIVKNFALYPEHCMDIQGMNECQLKPHILLFSDSSIKNVIPYFSQLVQQYKASDELKFRQDKPLEIKIISWNTDWKDDEASRSNPTKLRLEDYHQAFKKNEQKSKEDYKCLKSYIHFYDKKHTTLSVIRKNIFHALLKILRIENISTNKNRLYTISNLINYLKVKSELNYSDLNLKVYECCLKIIRNEKNQALSDLQTYIPVFISYFKENHKLSSMCSDFINNDTTGIDQTSQNHIPASNIIEENDLKIEITSVHSVKGQTHDATLYLESYYYEDGRGNNAKSYESQRLANQFLGNPFNLTTERAKQSTKMAYVGFSRATQLLCIAIHKDRFEQYLNTIDRDIWEIKDISS